MKFSLSATVFSLLVVAKGAISNKMVKMKKMGRRFKAKSKQSSSSSCEEDFECPHLDEYPSHPFGGLVTIANRAAGTVSLVDPVSLKTVTEYHLPDDGEPM